MKGTLFTATILSGHKEDAVEVPFDPAEAWGAAAAPLRPGRRGHRVAGTVNGTAFESAVVGRSRRFWLLLSEDVKTQAGVRTGDVVQVRLAPAAAPAAAPARPAPSARRATKLAAGRRKR